MAETPKIRTKAAGVALNSQEESNYASMIEGDSDICQGSSKCQKYQWFWCLLISSILIAAIALRSLYHHENPPSVLEESGYLDFKSSNNSTKTYFYRIAKRSEESSKKLSPEHTSKKCLILWINGGLGTSSHLGYYASVGPKILDVTTNELIDNSHAWTKLCDVLIVDQPMTTGLSNRKNSTDPERPSDKDLPTSYEEMSQDLRLFLLTLCAGRKYTDLHITGESLAGKIILRLAYFYLTSSRGNNAQDPAPTLRSAFMISPWIDAPGYYKSSLDYALESAMLTPGQVKALQPTMQACLDGITSNMVTLNDTKRCFAFYDQVLSESVSGTVPSASPDKYNVDYPASENPYTRLKSGVEKQLQAQDASFKINNARVAKMFALENHQDDTSWYARLMFEVAGNSQDPIKSSAKSDFKLRVVFGDKDFISNYKGGIDSINKALSSRGEIFNRSLNTWTGLNTRLVAKVLPGAGHFVCFHARQACFDIMRDLIA
jgi:carboxypeptidase C (cathepsin A)